MAIVPAEIRSKPRACLGIKPRLNLTVTCSKTLVLALCVGIAALRVGEEARSNGIRVHEKGNS